MKHLHCPTVALFVVFIFGAHGMFPAMAQAGPQDSQQTQLVREDAGKPMITACIGGDACQFLDLVDPGGTAVGPLYLDGGYFATCTPGACGVPAPFVAGTAVAAAAGVATGTLVGIGAGAGAAVALGVGLGVGLSGGSSPVQTGSQ